MTLACIRHIRHRYPNSKISVEVEKPGREGLQELSEEADVVFYSKSWAQVGILLSIIFRISFTDVWQANGYKSAEECVRKQSSRIHKA